MFSYRAFQIHDTFQSCRHTKTQTEKIMSDKIAISTFLSQCLHQHRFSSRSFLSLSLLYGPPMVTMTSYVSYQIPASAHCSPLLSFCSPKSACSHHPFQSTWISLNCAFVVHNTFTGRMEKKIGVQVN